MKRVPIFGAVSAALAFVGISVFVLETLIGFCLGTPYFVPFCCAVCGTVLAIVGLLRRERFWGMPVAGFIVCSSIIAVFIWAYYFLQVDLPPMPNWRNGI